MPRRDGGCYGFQEPPEQCDHEGGWHLPCVGSSVTVIAELLGGTDQGFQEVALDFFGRVSRNDAQSRNVKFSEL